MATNQLIDWSDVLSFLLGCFEQLVADIVLTFEILAAIWVGFFLLVFVGGLVLGLWNEEDSAVADSDCWDNYDSKEGDCW